MPLTNYFGGKGEAVMSAMQRRYGGKKGKSVFYATVNANRKGTPAQRAIQPHRPGSSLTAASKRRRRRTQLGTAPQASGQRIEGASLSTSRIGY